MKKSSKELADKLCSVPSSLKVRELISPIEAGGLAAIFKVLANDTRLRLLHALVRADELCVTDLATSVGMKSQAVSNQLQRLSDLGIIAARRQGTNIHYRIIDRCVSGLLEQAWCLMDEAIGQPTALRRARCCPGENQT